MLAFESLLHQKTQTVETLLVKLLSSHLRKGEKVRPEQLLAAMRHGTLAGGKRLRPFLLLETASLFGGNRQAALQVAASLEMVHCYSLIHDDLPAMDNDDLRRGQPTVHKKFDEATAILAGDGLLTLAFEILADLPFFPGISLQASIDSTIALRLIKNLAQASGLAGMIGGQMLDILAERQELDKKNITALQTMKTGSLIRYACEAGAILGQADERDIRTMAEFGATIGSAFQIADDLLDIKADTHLLGKTAGKDVKAGKATLVALHGEDWAKEELKRLTKQAHTLLDPFQQRGDILRQAALFIIQRNR